jgi:uncharacterized protein (DUF1919 family)
MFSYVSNNCLSQILYKHDENAYDSPFIGSIFVNDKDYIKLCKNYEYYLNVEPQFGEPKTDSLWAKQNGSPWYKHVEINIPYPVMYLEDIEIHWIHETDKNILLEKYKRRLARYRENGNKPLFLLAFSDLCNNHMRDDYIEMIKEFTDLEDSIYLTKLKEDVFLNRKRIYLIKDWMQCNKSRNSSHIYNFHATCNREKYMKEIIEMKKKGFETKYSIILPLKMESLNSFEIFKNIALPLYNEFLETEYIHYFYIICPLNNISKIKVYTDKYPAIPFKFINEDTLLSENTRNVEGWYKQQLIKLNISNIVETQYYLILDSDMYLNQNFHYTDIFHDGKLKYSYESWQTVNDKHYSTNSTWWMNSCSVLKYNYENLTHHENLMGVTPQIFITDEVKNLIRHIQRIYKTEDWQTILYQKKFTEFTLYWIYMIITDKTNYYTTSGFPLWKHDLERNVLYYVSEKEITDIIHKSFGDSESYFSVIQSYLPVNMEYIKKEIYRYIKPHYDAIFLVSSMVIPTELKYFSVKERFFQTLETAKSIKENFPNSYCLLIEGSSILPDEFKTEFSKYFDHILDLGKNPSVIKYVRNTVNIGHGEQRLLEKGIEFLQNSVLPYHKTNFIFKLGARYTISDNFDINNFDPTKFNFYEEFDEKGNSLEVYTTGMYTIPISELTFFRNILEDVHNHLSKTIHMIERYFYSFLPKEKVNVVKTLGLEGRLNYNGQFFSK